MKASLNFDLPEEKEAFEAALNGEKALIALHEIRQKIFRPARKSGYSNRKIEELLEKLDTLVGSTEGGATELISMLETEFLEILKDFEITGI
jgi:hypothetical protein